MPTTICPACGGAMLKREILESYGRGFKWVCHDCGYKENGQFYYYDDSEAYVL